MNREMPSIFAAPTGITRVKYLAAFISAMLCTGSRGAGVLIFDSYTPPASFSGFSSDNMGVASQVAVSQTTTILSFSIYNQMRSDGELKFLILGLPANNILYQSSPTVFNFESSFSWKSSPPLNFTLTAGQQYWIGYTRNVTVNDLGDGVHESRNGITSVGNTAIISGYASPVFSQVGFFGTDAPFQLYAVPESTSLIVFTLVPFLLRRRRW